MKQNDVLDFFWERGRAHCSRSSLKLSVFFFFMWNFVWSWSRLVSMSLKRKLLNRLVVRPTIFSMFLGTVTPYFSLTEANQLHIDIFSVPSSPFFSTIPWLIFFPDVSLYHSIPFFRVGIISNFYHLRLHLPNGSIPSRWQESGLIYRHSYTV